MCILYWVAKQRDVGWKIQSLIPYHEYYQNASFLPSYYFQTKMRALETLWKEFLSYQELLRSAGFQNKEYYSQIEKNIINYIEKRKTDIITELAPMGCDCNDDDKLNDEVSQFLENLKQFKDFLQTKRSALDSCKHPDILLHELKIRFELIKENFKKTSIVDDKKAQGEFSEVITIYCEMLMEISEQINKQERKANLPTTPTINETPPLSEVEKTREELLFKNCFDKLIDHLELNIKDPESIKNLMNSIENSLKSIKEMGLSIEAARKFIAEKIIEKFDDETFTQYVRCLKQSQEISVFDFLEYMMEDSQKYLNETVELPSYSEAISLQTNVNSIETTSEEEREITDGKQKFLLDKQSSQREYKEDNGGTTSSANDFVYDLENAVIEQLTISAEHGISEPPTLVTKPNAVIIFLPPSIKNVTRESFEKIYAAISEMLQANKMPLRADHKQGLFEIRLNSLDDSNSKRQSDEILENHIRNLSAGIIMKTVRMDRKIILNLQTPGISEILIRDYYKTAAAPTSFKDFITPLLEKTQTFLQKLIIFPEEEQETPNALLAQ